MRQHIYRDGADSQGAVIRARRHMADGLMDGERPPHLAATGNRRHRWLLDAVRAGTATTTVEH